MDTLRVRIYNVRFGDAILVTVPDGGVRRHILIDIGNAFLGEGGVDSLFKSVVEDVLTELGGQPLDLYVMTHEHMDHVQGLQYVQEKICPAESLAARLQVQHAWFPASSEPGYYERNTKAKEKLDEARAAYAAVERYLQAAPANATAWTKTLMALNDWRSTQKCVNFLRGLAQHPWYVHRGVDLAGKHPFQETQFEIWAPEEDTSIYYGTFHPVAAVSPERGNENHGQNQEVIPPPGVDAGAFFDLVEQRKRGHGDNLLAIDKAANNTSVVFCLTWRGHRLLFPGDAEVRSWQEMNKRLPLAPVDFLKVSHHASQTGMPPVDILDKLLPAGGGHRFAAVSTFPAADAPPEKFVYPLVPHPDVLAELARRTELRTVIGSADGAPLDFEFDG